MQKRITNRIKIADCLNHQFHISLGWCSAAQIIDQISEHLTKLLWTIPHQINWRLKGICTHPNKFWQFHEIIEVSSLEFAVFRSEFQKKSKMKCLITKYVFKVPTQALLKGPQVNKMQLHVGNSHSKPSQYGPAVTTVWPSFVYHPLTGLAVVSTAKAKPNKMQRSFSIVC